MATGTVERYVIRYKKHRKISDSRLSGLSGLTVEHDEIVRFTNVGLTKAALIFRLLLIPIHGAIMKDKDATPGSTKNIENVTEKNILTSEEIDKLSKGAKTYEGILIADNRVYRGQIKYTYWWGNDGGMFYCYASHYTINDPDGFSRHKANIHFSFDSNQWWGIDSPDSMRQDNQWNPWRVGGYIAANRRARVYVRFVFDLPFADVSGENSIYYTYP